MKMLTDKQLAVLDDEAHEAWKRADKATNGPWNTAPLATYEAILDQWGSDILCNVNRIVDAHFCAHARHDVPCLIWKLARALTPLPCGHPPGCVVSAPSAEGMDTTSHCGWCAVETDLAGSIEFNRDVATENLKLEAERDAVIKRLDEQETGPDYLCNALRAQLNKAEEAIKRYRKDLKMLREKLKAAKGLAEALEAQRLLSIFPSDNQRRQAKARIDQALAAWKAAND